MSVSESQYTCRYVLVYVRSPHHSSHGTLAAAERERSVSSTRSSNAMDDGSEMSPMPVGGGRRGLLVSSEALVLACCKTAAGIPLPAACGVVVLLFLLLGATGSGSVTTVRAVAILLVLAAGLLGAFMPWWLRSSARMLARGNSLSAGVMLSAGLIHMLGDASRELAPAWACAVNVNGINSSAPAAIEPPEAYPLAMLLCSVGFIVTMAAEGAGHYWQQHEGAGSAAGAMPSLLLTGRH